LGWDGESDSIALTKSMRNSSGGTFASSRDSSRLASTSTPRISISAGSMQNARDDSQQPAGECGWTADRAHAPVHDDECFLHHIFDDRGAVAMAPGVASNVRLQRHQ